jgi:hypothetical protein
MLRRSQLLEPNRFRWVPSHTYTSTLARRRQYLKEVSREELEMKRVPATELEEVRDVFEGMGVTKAWSLKR